MVGLGFVVAADHLLAVVVVAVAVGHLLPAAVAVVDHLLAAAVAVVDHLLAAAVVAGHWPAGEAGPAGVVVKIPGRF